MPSQTVVVSAEEVSQLQLSPDFPTPTFQELKSPVPWWTRVCLSALVPFLPILAIVAFVLRIAFRNQPRNVRYAWVSFMSTLLIVSALFSTVAAIVVVSFVPVPAIVNTGLPDLDERNQFVALPAKTALTSSDASEQLKPLVVVVSPTMRLWNHQDVAAPQFGAGALLFADKSGYLFATANHVVTLAADKSAPASGHAMVATASGVWLPSAVACAAAVEGAAYLVAVVSVRFAWLVAATLGGVTLLGLPPNGIPLVFSMPSWVGVAIFVLGFAAYAATSMRRRPDGDG